MKKEITFKKGRFYSVRLKSKYGIGLLTKELKLMGLQTFTGHKFNLSCYDCIKLQKRASNVLNDSFLVFSEQRNRSERVNSFKQMYPGYKIKDLNKIGIKI